MIDLKLSDLIEAHEEDVSIKPIKLEDLEKPKVPQGGNPPEAGPSLRGSESP